jgi:DNA topoisomerase-1
MIRVGNEDYARENKSYGLTTLRNRHVAVEGSKMSFRFKGKSGKSWNLNVTDRRIARIVRTIQELPGQHLFQYLEPEGDRRDVTSGDVNRYLKEISGRDITAKDFRTWTGTVLAALALAEFETFDSAAAAKRNVRAAIERVAARLGNTPTVCRKCYIHPEIVDGYLDKALLLEAKHAIEGDIGDGLAALRPEEAVVLAFLHQRLSRPKARNIGVKHKYEVFPDSVSARACSAIAR